MRQSSIQTSVSLKQDFNTIAAKPKPEKTVPISFRVTTSEKRLLEKKAGSQTIGHYARHQLLGSQTKTRPARYQKKQRQVTLDEKTLAQLLGLLGQSELGTSLLALAMAAQSGALHVDDELTDRLNKACDDVQSMRETLISSMNLQVEDGS